MFIQSRMFSLENPQHTYVMYTIRKSHSKLNRVIRVIKVILIG